MPGPPTPAEEVRNALGGAYGAAVRSPAVGTEHLLCGLTGPIGQPNSATLALASAELTLPVVMAVLRRRRSGGWRSDDAAGDEDLPPAEDPAWFHIFKSTTYTGAARAALHHAATLAAEEGLTEVGSGHLLQGLLAREDNRAVELVRGCGVAPASLLDRMRGADPATPAGGRAAPELGGPGVRDPLLGPIRDALLGRARYRRGRLSGRVVYAMLRIFPLVEVPTGFVFLDAPEQARRLGMRETGTEHLVLGILAITETLHSYPHLRPDHAEYRYRGGEVLAAAGVTYHDAREVAGADPGRLGRDARRWKSFRQPAWYRPSFAGTGELLLAVLTQDDSRGANLLRRLGVAPAAVRARLRTRPADS